MKKKFAEYYQYSKSEYKELGSKALIVLDTNILLGFYRFNEQTLSDFFSALEGLKAKEQLWLPNWVGREFFRNRLEVIQDQKSIYSKLINILKKPQSEIMGLQRSHAYVDLDDLSQRYAKAVNSLLEIVDKKNQDHPDYLSDDIILERISNIYSDEIVGEEWGKDRVLETIKEGESRYAEKIPPGFKDADKLSDDLMITKMRAYGDLIIWKQIIEKAKISNRPIIFVSDDTKDDWIPEISGNKMGAHPLLKKEIRIQAGVDFAIYNSKQFLEFSREYMEIDIDKGSILKVEELRREDELNALLNKKTRVKAVSENLDLYLRIQDLLRRVIVNVKYIIDDYSSADDAGIHDKIGDLNRVYQTALGIIIKVIADDAYYYNSNRLLKRIEALIYKCDEIILELEEEYTLNDSALQDARNINSQIRNLLRKRLEDYSTIEDLSTDFMKWPGNDDNKD